MIQIRRLLILALLASPASIAGAQSPASDLAKATLEELMDIKITTASHREQRADDVAAAVFVITQDDIRRSGMTTLPDLLRLVPGVQVAQINANKWAVSVRGFNGLFSDKLLVLLDGRSIYNHLFGGVLWDDEDLLPEDIDRIEVIRGPNAAAWGANAVNGVINIITKDAANTRGALVRAAGGAYQPGQVAVRYGGLFGSTNYRVDAQWSETPGSLFAPAAPAHDTSRRATVGFRSDWKSGPRSFTLEGSLTSGRATALWFNLDPTPAPNAGASVDTPSTMNGGWALGRWTRTRAGGASLQIQSVVEVAHRDEPVGDYRRDTADVDVEYHTRLGSRQDVGGGGGYRAMRELFAGGMGYALTPVASVDQLVNAYAQDDIGIIPRRLQATVAARIEHDTLAGWGVEPTARLTWDIVENRQHLWIATSRALRTPSLQDRGIRVDFPPAIESGLPVSVSISGSPDTRTEQLADIEMGYRAELAPVATMSVTGFFGHYSHLRTSEPLAPTVTFGAAGPSVFQRVVFGSLLGADTRGVEIDGRFDPMTWWQIDGSYTVFRLTPKLDPSSHDPAAAVYDGDAPSHQWVLHSGLSIRRTELDARLFHVGALRGLGVPAYTRADARVAVRLTPRLTGSIVGQNLLDRRHAEFAGAAANLLTTLVSRSARIELTWRY